MIFRYRPVHRDELVHGCVDTLTIAGGQQVEKQAPAHSDAQRAVERAAGGGTPWQMIHSLSGANQLSTMPSSKGAAHGSPCSARP